MKVFTFVGKLVLQFFPLKRGGIDEWETRHNQPDIKLIVISPIYSNPKADGTDRNPDRLASQSFASSASPVLYQQQISRKYISIHPSIKNKISFAFQF